MSVLVLRQRRLLLSLPTQTTMVPKKERHRGYFRLLWCGAYESVLRWSENNNQCACIINHHFCLCTRHGADWSYCT